MAGLSMVTRSAVFTPAASFPVPQSTSSQSFSRVPAWPKSSRRSFGSLFVTKSTSNEAKESEEEDKLKALKEKAEKDVEKATGKAGDINDTLKDAAETAADKAKKDVEGGWSAAKDTTDQLLNIVGGKEEEKPKE